MIVTVKIALKVIVTTVNNGVKFYPRLLLPVNQSTLSASVKIYSSTVLKSKVMMMMMMNRSVQCLLGVVQKNNHWDSLL